MANLGRGFWLFTDKVPWGGVEVGREGVGARGAVGGCDECGRSRGRIVYCMGSYKFPIMHSYKLLYLNSIRYPSG